MIKINVLANLKNDIKNFNILESPVILATIAIILAIIPLLALFIVCLIGVLYTIKYKKALTIKYKFEYSLTIFLLPLILFNGYICYFFFASILSPVEDIALFVKLTNHIIFLGNFTIGYIAIIGAVIAYIALLISNRLCLWVIEKNNQVKG